MRRRVFFVVVFLLASLAALPQTSPTPTPIPRQQQEGEGGDSDPTRSVVWSVRDEFYDLRENAGWANVLIFRSDRAFLARHPRIAGRRGFLTRFDFPLAVSDCAGTTAAGLGDLYAQVLFVPRLTNKSAFVMGSGFLFPTATDRRLGAGKFEIAPVIAPVWFIPQRGFFFIKVQGYISVAGSQARSDVHYLTTTPLLVWRLKHRPYWLQFDSETKTNFQDRGRTSFKSGILIGRMFKRRGYWVKPEGYWGRTRDADFAIKIGFFRVR